jgi:hypothetical protein
MGYSVNGILPLSSNAPCRGLDKNTQSSGMNGAQAAKLVNLFALFLYARANYTQAEPLMRRALAIDEASFGSDHPNVATRLNNLALLLKDTNRLSEAEPLMRQGAPGIPQRVAPVFGKWEACLRPEASDSAIMMATTEPPWLVTRRKCMSW